MKHKCERLRISIEWNLAIKILEWETLFWKINQFSGDWKQGRSQDFFREGTTFSKNYQKCSKNSKNFQIFSKIFSRKLLKCIILAFFTKFNKPSEKILRVWTKNAICRKFWENFRKLLKMHYFSIFFKKFNKPCVKFLRVWTINAMCRQFLRILSKIFKNIF